MTMMDAIM